jgi:siroheme synthase-like protein
MPSYYPVYLNLAGKKAVILGGGYVAEGKVAALLEAGVKLTIISPQATPGIQEAARRGDLEWQQRVYQPGDLQGAALVIAATNVWSVNQEICQEAEGLGILLNVCDDPDLCNFIAPALVKRGPVTLAISTGGASPALARKLRETLTSASVLEWADLAGTLARVRQELKQRRVAVDPERWQCCLTPDLLDLARQGREEEVFSLLMSRLPDGSAPGLCPQPGRCQPGGCALRSKDLQQGRSESQAGASAGRPRPSRTSQEPALPRGGEA